MAFNRIGVNSGESFIRNIDRSMEIFGRIEMNLKLKTLDLEFWYSSKRLCKQQLIMKINSNYKSLHAPQNSTKQTFLTKYRFEF